MTRALEFDCAQMIKCTRVDGIYDSDPETNPAAKKYDTITATKAMELNLKIMDQAAIAMAKTNKLSLIVCNINKIDLIGTNELGGTVVEITH
ncbi:MAG: hypothetical protein H6766_05220 [Candidatus Peribacteria bacterium]|nr:MAG: hypothetical protein H6766_05220 [Candidatus Peribacteria bacterium]